jgi:hypothetical protein
MTSSTALVTGANSGIGKEIARQLAATWLTVYGPHTVLRRSLARPDPGRDDDQDRRRSLVWGPTGSTRRSSVRWAGPLCVVTGFALLVIALLQAVDKNAPRRERANGTSTIEPPRCSRSGSRMLAAGSAGAPSRAGSRPGRSATSCSPTELAASAPPATRGFDSVTSRGDGWRGP